MLEKITLKIAVLLLVVLAEVFVSATRRSYDGYSLFRCTPETLQQLDVLVELSKKRTDGIEFWTEPGALGKAVDVMASPDRESEFDKIMISSGMKVEKIMHNVGDVIKKTSRDLECRVFNNLTRAGQDVLRASVFFRRYSRYEIIESKLRDLARDPMVSLQTIGKSSEGRDIYLVKVSKDNGSNKPIVFIDAGHHAREWISHVTLLYILESLINRNIPTISSQRTDVLPEDEINIEDSQPVVNERGTVESEFYRHNVSVLDNYDFWFIPVVNPDGYEYTHTYDRLWRKTRSGRGFCRGVDPNRNYPFHWLEEGASRSPCSDIYAGPRAASEPEVAAVVETLNRNKDRIVLYLSMHAYSQVILSPYGYKRVYPDNFNELERVAEAATKAIYSVRKTEYRHGVSSILLYPAAGGSDDYAHGVAKIRYSYTWELPDKGSYGFLLPASEIVPTGHETVVGIRAMLNAL